LTFGQRTAVKEFGYLLSEKEADTVGKMLGASRDKEAEAFAKLHGTKVRYSI
jgi:hypothetical protein